MPPNAETAQNISQMVTLARTEFSYLNAWRGNAPIKAGPLCNNGSLSIPQPSFPLSVRQSSSLSSVKSVGPSAEAPT